LGECLDGCEIDRGGCLTSDNRIMCGRYQRRSDKQKIAEAFHIGNVDGLALELAPDYNAAPQSTQPVIIWDEQFGTRTLHMMFWRFLPPFVIDPKKFRLDTINARGESLLSSDTWRESFLTRRCLVPVDSFVEWRRVDAKTKLPWMFAMSDDEPFALGGVWRRWRSPDRETEMETFAIITTEPNELLVEKTGHDRMPAIIKKADYQRWLHPGSPEQPPIDLVRPYDSDKMKAWRVDRRINNVRNNEPALSEAVKEDDPPADEPRPATKATLKRTTKDDGQLPMF
jgi:putative SOS response-associated peptidase YedK